MSEEKAALTEEERRLDFEYRTKLMEYFGRAAQGTAAALARLDPDTPIFLRVVSEVENTESPVEKPSQTKECTDQYGYESPWLWAFLVGMLGAGAPPADPLADKRDSGGLVGVVSSMLEAAVNLAGMALEAKMRARAPKPGGEE